MCGVAGYIGPRIDGLAERMIASLRHRGPDGEGVLTRDGLVLCHTRLAIVDLSEHGAQPMERLDGRIAVSFNGEIYNYEELRSAITCKGYRFTGHSDTELLPFGFAAFGAEFFRRLDGMYAFALHDARDSSVYLVRDHFGIKPFYYAVTRNGLVFSSSARTVALHPDVDSGLDEGAIRDFLQFRYVPSGKSFYRGVQTLPPGHQACWRDGKLTITEFWQPRRREPKRGRSADQWVQELDEAFSTSVRQQLRSDVPVGIFLSGGIDSAAVMHYATRHAPAAPTAFTFAIGDDHDETDVAREISASVGAEQVVVRMPANRPLDRLVDAVACMDVPVGDAIILPTYLLCEAAARQRKVVLTGEGADELFGGYIHVPVLRMLSRLAAAGPLLRPLAPLLKLAPIGLLDPLFQYQASLGIQGRAKVAALVGAIGRSGAAARLATSVIDDDQLLEGTSLAAASYGDADLTFEGLLLDGVRSWLPYQILNKMDQLSMAHGLEARVPYLAPRVYDLLLEVPDELLLKRGQNKVLLRELLKREQLSMFGRKKHAFHLPLESLYRNELEELARTWLSTDAARRHGIVKPAFVESRLQLLRNRDFLASKQLVVMIVLHMWLDADKGLRA
jgi:asparagine synthase (glutamine-hydrolysing)